MEERSNGFGKAGLAMAIISLFIGWIPVIGYIGVILAIVFSMIGLFRSPRGTAIAGLIITCIAIAAIAIIYMTAGLTILGLGGFESVDDLLNQFTL